MRRSLFCACSSGDLGRRIRLLKPLRIEALQVYVSGQNLWTISDFDLWDPEITTTRTDLYEYPNLKTVSIGLNLSF